MPSGKTDAVRTRTQQGGLDAQPRSTARTRHVAVPGLHYEAGRNLTRPAMTEPYRRRPDEDPLYRPLRIYMRDPVHSAYAGAVVVVAVPYERLRAGPVGARLEVVAEPGGTSDPLDLDAHGVLIGQGIAPSPGDRRFHHQMVYAVGSLVLASFAVALGREPSWGFTARPAGQPDRLRLCPHDAETRNAFYDRHSGALRFGCFEVDATADHAGARVPPGGRVYTCLSHDIVVHEMTHALLDGMRSHFAEPTNPDVLAFHEAFADIVAILQQFSYRAGVRDAIEQGRGRLDRGGIVFSIAEQFGRAIGGSGPVRSWLDRQGEPARYARGAEPHELGSVLVGAVLEALTVVFERRVKRLRTLHEMSGSPPSLLHPHYLDLLADAAAKVAGQFLTLCIRAVDYCPPVDITFGEYLRALITADRDLVEDDPLGYRDALIAAFGRRGIFPLDVQDLSESSLLWCRPRSPLPAIEGLHMANLRFAADPALAPPAAEILRQAGALADVVTDPAFAPEFGLDLSPGTTLPVIESIRTLRRVGPDRQVRFGLVAEVVQERRYGGTLLHGGATVILGGDGGVRYVIRKRVDDAGRAQRQAAFHDSGIGRRALAAVATGQPWMALHAHRCA